MGEGLGRGILEVVMALTGIALVSLILVRSKNASQLIQTSGSTLSQLYSTLIQGGSSFGGGNIPGNF